MPICTRCPLHHTAKSVCVPGSGSNEPDILFVGRDPGTEEDQIGKPFVGASGKLLRGMVSDAGIDQSRVRYTNSVRCHTPNNVGPTQEQIQACRAHLHQEIQQTDPKLIVALGLEAARSLLGGGGALKSLRGSVKNVEILGKERSVLVTYHPAAILRNPSFASDFAQDMSIAVDVLNNKISNPLDVRIVSLRNIDHVRDLVDRIVRDRIAFQFDLETTGIYPWNGGRILCCSLAYRPDEAYVFPVSYGYPEDGDTWGDVRSWEEQIIPILKNLLECDAPKGGHNTFGVDTLYPLVLYGIRIKNVQYDTLLMHYVLDERVGTHGLDVLAARVGMAGYDKTMEERLEVTKSGGEIHYGKVEWDILSWYCAMDSLVSLLLRDHFMEDLRRNKDAYEVYSNILLNSSWSLLDLTLSGVKIDVQGLSKIRQDFNTKIEDVEHKIREMDCVKKFEETYFLDKKPKEKKFNPNSTQHLTYIFHRVIGVETKAVSKKTGRPSMDRSVLSGLAQKHELAARILDLRGLLKERDTYLREIAEYTDPDGLLHPGFRLFTTVTGRLSSSDPALQNFPKKSVLRKLFISRFSPDGCLVEADQSQMELRVLAQLSGDKLLRQAYCETGRDLHRLTASQIFNVPEFDEPVQDPSPILYKFGFSSIHELQKVFSESPDRLPKNFLESYTIDSDTGQLIRLGVTKSQRDHAKRVNFGIVYGIQDVGLSSQLGVSRDVAAEYIANYLSKFKGVAAYIEEVKKYLHRKKHVKSVFGRVRHLPEVASNDKSVVLEAERQAVNFTIQSPASDITLLALRKLIDWLKATGKNSVVWNIIHDAILLDCPLDELHEVASATKIFMEDRTDYPWLSDVPLVAEVSIGENWLACKEEGSDITESLCRYIDTER